MIFATEIGKVTNDGKFNLTAKDGNLQLETKQLRELWEDAIPCLLKSEV